MKDVATFLGLLSAASALYALPNNRAHYNKTLLGRLHKIKAPSQYQRLECYDQNEGKGNKITIGVNPVVDLSQLPYEFNNRIRSCRFNGNFVLYDDKNYNSNNPDVSFKVIHEMRMKVAK